MVNNALAGTAAGFMLGLTEEEIKSGIEALVPLDGRNHLIETGKFTVIDDCYNANPGSMKASLDVLAQADTRTVAVLGDMGELGDGWKEMHRQVGKHASERGIQMIICIGEMAGEIADGASTAAKAQAGQPAGVLHYDTKAAFFADMESILKPGDTILVKASHMMGFSEIVEKLQNL
jgi:UDP-N-acetylmuramoyl-tripeptide--D-alanyl-D-alanine ligase